MTEEYKIIPIYLESGADGSFTLNINGELLDNNHYSISIEDLKENTIEVIDQETDLTFNASTTDPSHRYNLHLSKGANGITETMDQPVSIYAASNKVYFDLSSKAEVSIYNVTGQLVYSNQLTQGQTTITLSQPNGTYLIKTITDDKVDMNKVFIQN